VFSAPTAGHDPLVAARLIYQMFAKLLSGIVLHTRSDTSKAQHPSPAEGRLRRRLTDPDLDRLPGQGCVTSH
jgi:hypothetical protein